MKEVVKDAILVKDKGRAQINAFVCMVIQIIITNFKDIINYNIAEESAIMMAGVRKTEGSDAYTTLFPCLW